MADPTVAARGENAGLSDDVDAYDLILKDKERLLSLDEPVRFIFSHSALREGWDNPNVFVICTLKHSDNTISRRQEVGRGLRLAVNQQGERMDHPETVHAINVLTVVASESYKDFVASLQAEISDSLSARPHKANADYFEGKVLGTPQGDVIVTAEMAKQIERYLIRNDYIDTNDLMTPAYDEASRNGTLAPLPEALQPVADQVHQLIDSVFRPQQLPTLTDDRRPKTNPLNHNFYKKEFQALWQRINRKAAYSVKFDADELILKAIAALNHKDEGLRITPLQYTIHSGQQADLVTPDMLARGSGFRVEESFTARETRSVHSSVRYDLIGQLADGTRLTRRDIAEILKGLDTAIFEQFKTNPESFITEAIRIINEQKASIIVEHLAYDPLKDTHDLDIFTAAQTRQDFSQAGDKLQRHIYDYALTDSRVERDFVQELDTAQDVVVYAKLPRGFLIPTPVGDYNPDWAIAFREGSVKHIYFVAETKGSMSSLSLREIERAKIQCARKFFEKMSQSFASDQVRYDVVDSFERLMEVVS